jgi:hypothetical protein
LVLPDIFPHDRPGDGGLAVPVMTIVTVSSAFSEYHNAGGWPATVWVLATTGYARFVFGHKPASESEIKREMERQAGQRR